MSMVIVGTGCFRKDLAGVNHVCKCYESGRGHGDPSCPKRRISRLTPDTSCTQFEIREDEIKQDIRPMAIVGVCDGVSPQDLFAECETKINELVAWANDQQRVVVLNTELPPIMKDRPVKLSLASLAEEVQDIMEIVSTLHQQVKTHPENQTHMLSWDAVFTGLSHRLVKLQQQLLK